MRNIKTKDIERIVEKLCVKANMILRKDVLNEIERLFSGEKAGSLSKKMLGVLIENAGIARSQNVPLCQDTGMVVVFIELGEDVRIYGGYLYEAVNNGVKKAYIEKGLRKSVVDDPIRRNNTGTNTPAIIHIDITKGEKLGITVMPKGFGSENKSSIAMLNPTCSVDDIAAFCVNVVKKAGPDACPPYVLGVGIGGTMDYCALLAKKALLRPINKDNSKVYISDLEKKIKDRANDLNIGVMGLGGKTTVLGVNIETAPTHIAGMPVAVNLSCHALRSARAVM
ncbi:MAG: fumarate hydratase [Candidatus Omnitrophota bacterium]